MKKALLVGCAIALVFSNVGCKSKKDKDKDDDTTSTSSESSKSKKSDTTTTSEGENAVKKDSKSAATAGCVLPEGDIKNDVTLEKGCSIELKDSIHIDDGGSLTIKKGVKLAFPNNGFLDVRGGKLVIEGTEKEPVILTSASKTQANGDWSGIDFEGAIEAGNSLNYVQIEYAGQDSHGCHGGVTVEDQKSGKRISITNTTVSNTDHDGFYVSNEKGVFAKFENNHTKGMKIGLRAPAQVLASVGTNDFGGAPIETFGDVTDTVTWTNFGTPLIVKEPLKINNDGSAPVLTLAPGTVLKFAGGSDVDVGEKNGGGFVCQKCSFTSANASPQAGDWVGIILEERASNVDISGSTIEYAGMDSHGGHAAITFDSTKAKDARNVKLDGVSVKNSKGAALSSSDNDCAGYAKTVTSDGDVCRKP